MSSKTFSFSTKAQNLASLHGKLTHSTIPTFEILTVSQWISDRTARLNSLVEKFDRNTVVVRSSALAEDSKNESKAGMFTSVLGIETSKPDTLASAIDEVVASYGRETENDDLEEYQIIVQDQVTNVLASGVLFTFDMNTGAPYYVLNYDDTSGRTDSVTSGIDYTSRTLYVLRTKWESLSSPRFKALIQAVREIEEHTGCRELDVEFAILEDLTVVIFQVRPISTKTSWNPGISHEVYDSADRVTEALEDRFGTEEDHSLGGHAVLGNMSDWNPAEMIGTSPKPLASSLYRDLITDQVWRKSRKIMGYTHIPGASLMLLLAGQPYIDVRESFRSFVPKTVPVSICEKLVTHWLETLRRNHYLHDKIEFEIAITCHAPDHTAQMKRLEGVLTQPEISEFGESLKSLTRTLLMPGPASIDVQMHHLEIMAQSREEILRDEGVHPLQRVAALLEQCREHGTIPFGILARHGFIATTILQGLVCTGAWTEDEKETFLGLIPTVATDLAEDTAKLSLGKIDLEEFLQKYGHLRPGTYDITSADYRTRFAMLKGQIQGSGVRKKLPRFEPTPQATEGIQKYLSQLNADITPENLLTYMSKAIQGREYGKFCFTRNLGDALELIAAWGDKRGLSREELSYLTITDILHSASSPGGRTLERSLREIAEQREKEHRLTMAVRLPYLITQLSDVHIIPLVIEAPNFITRGTFTGPVLYIEGSQIDIENCTGKIVAIKSADPGFDWIFSQNIKGLITRFGGANSHMAVRCAEFGLPAAIGCGEALFQRVIQADQVELNCEQGRIEIF